MFVVEKAEQTITVGWKSVDMNSAKNGTVVYHYTWNMFRPIISHLFAKAVTHKMSFKTVSQKHAKLSCKQLQYTSIE